jgi:uncharacterized protein YdhG (YjbR/CyaY superfamily)
MQNLKYKNVDQYISNFNAEIQVKLEVVRSVIKQSMPDAVECISYNIPSYKKGKKTIYFAAYINHIGMYPMSDIEELDLQIKPYRAKCTKDSIHFKHKDKLPLDLIAKIVKAKLK